MKAVINVALLCSVPLLATFAPTIWEKARSFTLATDLCTAYEGDGILIGDTGADASYWSPSVSTDWQISQEPLFGEVPHDISIFVVRMSHAPYFLYRFQSNYASDYFSVDGGLESVSMGKQHLDLRRYVYLLPKEYTPPGARAEALFNVTVEKESMSIGENAQICQFQNARDYRDFLDMEPGAIHQATKCENQSLNEPQDSHAQAQRNDASSVQSLTLADAKFTAAKNSYNFFSTIVPTKSLVKFEANLTMYFYNYTRLKEHRDKISEYKCTIRDTDTCSFTTAQNLKQLLVIAYIHPKSGPYSSTTTIAVEKYTQRLSKTSFILTCVLVPSFLIKTLLF